VEIAPNGSIALKKFADGHYDLILMDIQMPVMDGHETTRIIRNELHADIPIIGCSAHALASEKAKCMEIGMNDYITKPYNEALMVKTIAKQLQKGEKAPSSAISEEERLVTEDLKSLNQLEREEGKEFVNLVVNLFKKTTAKDIAELETHHRMENYKSLSEKAHYLFGTLANLRFLHGCALCKEVEHAAKSEAEEKTTSATQTLVKYLGLLASKITA